MSHVGEYAPRWSVAPASDAICGTSPTPEFTRFSGLQWQSSFWASDCGLVEWSSRSIHCASEERGLTATQKHLSLQFSVGSDIVRVDNTFSVAAYHLCIYGTLQSCEREQSGTSTHTLDCHRL